MPVSPQTASQCNLMGQRDVLPPGALWVSFAARDNGFMFDPAVPPVWCGACEAATRFQPESGLPAPGARKVPCDLFAETAILNRLMTVGPPNRLYTPGLLLLGAPAVHFYEKIFRFLEYFVFQ